MVSPAFWRGRSVFVTGHTGFKGAWLSLLLARLGARVMGYALPPPTTPSLWELANEPAIANIVGDIRDSGAVARAMAQGQPEVVFHLAAQSLVRPSYRDPVATYATNVIGTVNVLEAVRGMPSVRAAVIITSDKCYDNRQERRSYREDDAMGGDDPYSSSKGCAELVVAAYRKSFFASRGVAIASARAGNVIGGGDWALDRLVPDIVRAVSAAEPVLVRNPKAVRPWQHVLEPLSGYLLLAERLCEAPLEYAEGWNFGPGDDQAVSVERIISDIARLWGPPARWEQDHRAHPHEAPFLNLDSTKARSKLGWAPRLRLETALQWTVDWYRQHHQGSDARALSLRQIEQYMAL